VKENTKRKFTNWHMFQSQKISLDPVFLVNFHVFLLFISVSNFCGAVFFLKLAFSISDGGLDKIIPKVIQNVNLNKLIEKKKLIFFYCNESQ
jgi:hypothetical protein